MKLDELFYTLLILGILAVVGYVLTACGVFS